MSNGDTCTQILCRAQDYPDDGSLTIALNATGAGGIALNSNFNKLQYRQPKCNYTPGLGDPSKGIGGGQIYCVGSRWLNTDAGSGASLAMWICVDNSAQDNAVWSPWAFWVNPATWSGGIAAAGPLGASVPQTQSLAYANAHFSIEGEYRSIYFNNQNVGSPVVLVPQQTGLSNGAVILGIHGQAPGGDSRGPSAVDFQNSRAVDAQVASGSNSFIAGGKNNRAAGDTSHAQGEFSQATGASSHAEGAGRNWCQNSFLK
ncbi:MAG: hypothetical protein ABIZ07_14500, partial [Dermatophilaceae bacterium]